MTLEQDAGTTELENALLATVAYSDVFDMPVSVADSGRFLVGVRAAPADITATAEQLLDEGRLSARDDLLYLPDRAEVLAIHDDRRARAEAMWPQARRWSRLLTWIPYVRMVAVTGGLACDSVEAHDDIDLFVVTAPGRLWLTRLAIVVVVRIAGLRGPELCPNYIVASDSLEMDVRTQYVARELAQTIPLCGSDVWDQLLDVNGWYREHLPNAERRAERQVASGRPGPLRAAIEWAFSRSAFDRLEAAEMKRKVKRLTAVSSRRPEVGRPDESAFSPSVCKGHMDGNAAGIEVAWRERITKLSS